MILDTTVEIKVAAMTPEDLADVLRLEEETNVSRWSADSYLSEITNKDSVALSIKYRGELKGFLVARLIIFEISNIHLKEAEILNIAVHKSFQNMGFGQKLAEEFFRIAELRDISEIWLEVRKSNIQAINFYKKNGFSQQFERENYYSAPLENALVMRKISVSGKNSKVL